MEAYLLLQEQLIALEKQEEIDRYENYNHSSLKLLELDGLAVRRLTAESQKTTAFGTKNITFSSSFESNISCLSNGDIVSIEQGNQRQRVCTGVVYKVQGNLVQVSISKEDSSSSSNSESESGSESIDTSHNIPCYHLVKLANDITYKRYNKTIDFLKKEILPFSGSPLYELLSKMFSNYQGISRKIPIVRENDSQITDNNPLLFHNQNLNQSQKDAIEFCLNPDRILSCIQGPPGTGKTTTVVELILQASVRLGWKILCVAPSNIAVDNILVRLAEYGEDLCPAGKIIRLGHPARMKIKSLARQTTNKKSTKKIEKLIDLTNYSFDARLEQSEQKQLANDIQEEINDKKTTWRDRKQLYSDLRDRENRAREEIINSAEIVLSTTTSVLFGHQNNGKSETKQKNFDLVIIDEASQCVEIAALQSVICAKRLVLAGDHQQLPPTILSHAAAEQGMQNTLLERAVKYFGDEVHKLLNVQYRMHQKIMKWSNKKFYHDLVKSDVSCKDSSKENLPTISFVDTANCDFYEEQNEVGSYSNKFEAEIIRIQVEKLMNEFNFSKDEIGVITPYSAQTKLVKSILENDSSTAAVVSEQQEQDTKLKTKVLEVSTVDGFQGREKSAILLTLVRSNNNHAIGFLKDIRRLNVAITRAKIHVFVVGDSQTLSNGENGVLKDFVEFLQEESDSKIFGNELEFGDEHFEVFRGLRAEDGRVVETKFTATKSKEMNKEPSKKHEEEEKLQRNIQSALDKVTAFLNNPIKKTMKFVENPVIRAKIHDFIERYNETEKTNIEHVSYDDEKGGHRVLRLSKPESMVQREKEEETIESISLETNVENKFSNLAVKEEIGEKNDDIAQSTTQTIPENTIFCSLCGKYIPKDNYDLHIIHCARYQERKKQEAEKLNKKLETNQNNLKNVSKSSNSNKKSSKKSSTNSDKNSKTKKSTSKPNNKKSKRGNMNNLDDILDFINDSDDEVQKPKGESLVQQIIREGSNKPKPRIPESRTRDIKKKQLQNKLRNELNEKEKDRVKKEKTKKKK